MSLLSGSGSKEVNIFPEFLFHVLIIRKSADKIKSKESWKPTDLMGSPHWGYFTSNGFSDGRSHNESCPVGVSTAMVKVPLNFRAGAVAKLFISDSVVTLLNAWSNRPLGFVFLDPRTPLGPVLFLWQPRPARNVREKRYSPQHYSVEDLGIFLVLSL